MKRFVTIFGALLFFACASYAQQPFHLRFGVEWGGAENLYSWSHFNYRTSEGYRVDDPYAGFDPNFNGFFNVFVGNDISEKVSVTLSCGFSGLHKGLRALPVQLRGFYFPKGNHYDGLILYGDIGADMLNFEESPCLIGDAGSGWRLALGGQFALDFLAGLRISMDRPVLMDPDSGKKIPAQDINACMADYLALTFSIAPNF